jgi:hypothetical protein
MIMLDYPGPDDACIRGQWRAFEEMKAAGLVRSLAVSNFSPVRRAPCSDMPETARLRPRRVPPPLTLPLTRPLAQRQLDVLCTDRRYTKPTVNQVH